MNKKNVKYYIPTILITLIAAGFRLFCLMNYIDSANGKYETVGLHIANIAVAAFGILVAARCLTAKFSVFKVNIPDNSALFTVTMILFVMGSLTNAYACFTEYIYGTNVFASLMCVFAIISAVMFFILAIKQGEIKPATVYILSVAPFGYCVLKLIRIFNIYSKNISLHPYRYEILGTAALLLLLIYFVKAACEKGPGRSAMVLSQVSFFFLITFALPRLVGEYLPYAIFNEGSNIYYVYADLILGVGALLLGKYITIGKAGKH